MCCVFDELLCVFDVLLIKFCCYFYYMVLFRFVFAFSCFAKTCASILDIYKILFVFYLCFLIVLCKSLIFYVYILDIFCLLLCVFVLFFLSRLRAFRSDVSFRRRDEI